MQSDFSVLILAGGKSSRMNYPKAYLNINGKTIIENIIDTYRSFTDNIYVVLNYEFALYKWQNHMATINDKANIIINHHPENGRTYSLKLGLNQVPDNCYCFIHNVDNPISSNIISLLLENKNETGYTVPSCNGENGHPILISKMIIKELIKTNNNMALNEFLLKYNKTKIEVNDPSILVNMNTIKDYDHYLELNE